MGGGEPQLHAAEAAGAAVRCAAHDYLDDDAVDGAVGPRSGDCGLIEGQSLDCRYGCA